MDWLTVAERLGVPFAILAGVGFAIYRGFRYLGLRTFGKDGFLPPLLKAHTDFLHSVNANLGSQSEDLKEQTQILREIGTSMEALTKMEEAEQENLARLLPGAYPNIHKKNGEAQ